jgi:arabinofuranosyltransferase
MLPWRPSLPTRQAVGLLGWILLALGPAFLLGVMIWQRRWTSDDGFINFRVVSNLLAGHGPVFNLGERVEAFTSPLWIALLSGLELAGVELEQGAAKLGLLLAVSGVLFAQLGALTLLGGGPVRLSSLRRRFAVPLGMLCFAVLPPAWDFGTAGLETGLCLAWLGLSYWLVAEACDASRSPSQPPSSPARRPIRCHGAAFVLGLGPLVRPKLALFSMGMVVPLVMAYRRRRTTRWPSLVGLLMTMAALPLAYQIFRMGYYGALVPNTALAKEAFSSRWDQGWSYAQNFFGLYLLPVPLALIAVSWDGLARRAGQRRDCTAIALLMAPPIGGLLSILYVVKIGGGFMHGRMFLPAVFGTLLPVAMVPLRVPSLNPRLRWPRWIAAGIVTGWALHCGARIRVGEHNVNMIGDERGWYCRKSGVKHPVTLNDYRGFGFYRVALALRDRGAGACQDGVWPDQARVDHPCSPFVLIDDTRTFGRLHPHVEQAPVAPGAVDPRVAMVVAPGALGIVGQVLGPAAHLEDRYGLSNPVGARLEPGRRNRPGHEKKLLNVWLAARFAAPQADEDPRVSAARRALGCGALARLQDAVSGELTLQRFVQNIGAAWPLHRLRIPSEPWKAEQQLCDDPPFRVSIKGGPGGGPRRFHCPPGQVVTSIGGSLSSRSRVVESIAPRCQRLDHQGGDLTLGRRQRVGTRIGRPAGPLVRLGCPDGHSLSGIYGGASKLVHRLGPVCRRQAPATSGSDEAKTFRGPTIGQGGKDFELTCSESEVLMGVVARSGSLIDAVGIVCADRAHWR